MSNIMRGKRAIQTLRKPGEMRRFVNRRFVRSSERVTYVTEHNINGFLSGKINYPKRTALQRDLQEIRSSWFARGLSREAAFSKIRALDQRAKNAYL